MQPFPAGMLPPPGMRVVMGPGGMPMAVPMHGGAMLPHPGAMPLMGTGMQPPPPHSHSSMRGSHHAMQRSLSNGQLIPAMMPGGYMQQPQPHYMQQPPPPPGDPPVAPPPGIVCQTLCRLWALLHPSDHAATAAAASRAAVATRLARMAAPCRR
jgi:hypothetical protein